MLAWLGRFCWPPEPPGGLRQELVWRQVCLQCLARLWAPVLQTWLAGLPWLSLRRTFSTLVWTSGSLCAAHPCAQSKRLLRRFVLGRKEIYRQALRANIWSAVLAVAWPVVSGVIVWPGPEVLLSRLPRKRSDYTYSSASGWPRSSGWALLGVDAGAGDFKLAPARLQFSVP